MLSVLDFNVTTMSVGEIGLFVVVGRERLEDLERVYLGNRSVCTGKAGRYLRAESNRFGGCVFVRGRSAGSHPK